LIDIGNFNSIPHILVFINICFLKETFIFQSKKKKKHLFL
jgi:hypothetical protein